MFARAGALLLLGGFAACSDELPTLSGDRHFPPGGRPTTLEVELDAAGTIEELGVFAGYIERGRGSLLLAANQLGGVLDAHMLAAPAGFPASVTIGTTSYSRIEFVGGEFFALVDTIGTAAEAVDVELWTVVQEWHRQSMTWSAAVDTAGVRVEWETPGGTRGERIGVSTWDLRATVEPRRDTVGWSLTAQQVNALREEEVHGLLLRPAEPDTRIQIATAGMRLDILVRRDTADAARDTVVTRTIGVPAGYIFDPPPPTPASDVTEGWWAGGVTGARTLFRVTLPETVPGCAAPESCPAIALRDVSLTAVTLLLDPLPAPAGFLPFAPVRLVLRRLLEPELGRLAPLGPTVGEQSLEAAAFANAEGVFEIRFTSEMSQLLERGESSVSLALLARTEGSNFGFARFAGVNPEAREGRRAPRVRIIYTIPGRQALP